MDSHPTMHEIVGTLNQLLEQIEKMRGQFPDEDGTIAAAVEAGEQLVIDLTGQHKVKIRWGSLDLIEDEPATTYTFSSKLELDAFMEGVDAANGWLDYEVIEDETETPEGTIIPC